MKLCLSMLLVLSSSLFSQEQAVKHSLRILPLGDPPPFQQEIRDGIRHEIPPEEGTIPPRDLKISPKPPEGQEPVSFPMKLRLGYMSAPMTFPLPPDRKIDADLQDGGSWLDIPLAAGDATLALVFRGGKDWYQPRVLSVPDDAKGGDVVFLNVTGKPMGIVWGQEKLKLEPGKRLVRRIDGGAKAVAVSILYPTAAGALKACLSTQVENEAKTCQQFVIYAADGVNTKEPVKVLPLSEQI
jgi:hypothetical protein